MRLVLITLGALCLAFFAASSCAIDHRSGDFECTTQADCQPDETCTQNVCTANNNNNNPNDGGYQHPANCSVGYCGNGYYLAYEYTHTDPAGQVTFDAESGGPWPLKPGTYQMRLLLDDGYRDVARSVEFVVRP